MTGSISEISNLVIRRISAAEADQVIVLFDQYRVFYKQPSDMQLAAEFIKVRLESNESVVFVASDNDASVGFTQLYPTYSSVRAEKNWILNDLYVDESHRKHGTGKLLIEAAISFAKEHGAKFIQLETAKDNYTAQRLYEAIGFVKQPGDGEFLLYKFNLK